MRKSKLTKPREVIQTYKSKFCIYLALDCYSSLEYGKQLVENFCRIPVHTSAQQTQIAQSLQINMIQEMHCKTITKHTKYNGHHTKRPQRIKRVHTFGMIINTKIKVETF
jgi:hypothetical protein